MSPPTQGLDPLVALSKKEIRKLMRGLLVDRLGQNGAARYAQSRPKPSQGV